MTEPVSVIEKAYAKVNLTLEILGKRRDGYHDLASVMQTVNLFDTITVSEADSIIVECDDREIDAEINLATKAATVLKNRTGFRSGAKISIKKSIPVSAGLGGGSSDAAATLRGLNQIWKLGLSVDELADIAASVGSDETSTCSVPPQHAQAPTTSSSTAINISIFRVMTSFPTSTFPRTVKKQ